MKGLAMSPADAVQYLSTIPADEPVFVLRAKDVYAPSAIVAWSGLVGAPIGNKPPSDKSVIKAVAARKLAEEMRQWQERNYLNVKIPD
jgi:hypothetical protein